MPFGTKSETVFPTRGVPGGWRDWWDLADLDEIAAIRQRVVAFDARTVAVATALQRDERRERKRREREKARARRQA